VTTKNKTVRDFIFDVAKESIICRVTRESNLKQTFPDRKLLPYLTKIYFVAISSPNK
jgi:hypothetical protein